jgi:hypothetical protein
MTSVLTVAIIGLVATLTSAAAQSGGTQKACRLETMEACVKRQMALHDPVSGVAIQREQVRPQG